MAGPEDAAVGDPAGGDNLTPEGEEGAAPGSETEGQAGDQGEQGQPSESSTENDDQGKTAQERIDEITGRFRSTERDRDYWKERAIAAEESTPRPQPEVKLDKTLADFDGDEAKFAAYVSTETAKVYDRETAAQAEERRFKESRAEFVQHENDFAKDIPDYDTVTRQEGLDINEHMRDYILSLGKDGPALYYRLAKDPTLATEISKLSPMQAAARMATLQATDLAKPAASATQTPAPGARLPGRQHSPTIVTTSVDSDKLATDEWMKRERARLAKLAEGG